MSEHRGQRSAGWGCSSRCTSGMCFAGQGRRKWHAKGAKDAKEEIRGRRSVDGGRWSVVGGQQSEVRDRRSEVRGRGC